MSDLVYLKQAIDAIEAADIATLQSVVEEHPGLLDRVFMGRFTLLNYAASYNQISSMKFLVDAGMPIHSDDESFDPPILAASQKGNLEAVQWLVENGAEINGMKAYRPIVGAIYSGDEDLIRWLIDNGAEIDFRFGQFNQTLVEMAQRMGESHQHVVELLQSYEK